MVLFSVVIRLLVNCLYIDYITDHFHNNDYIQQQINIITSVYCCQQKHTQFTQTFTYCLWIILPCYKALCGNKGANSISMTLGFFILLEKNLQKPSKYSYADLTRIRWWFRQSNRLWNSKVSKQLWNSYKVANIHVRKKKKFILNKSLTATFFIEIHSCNAWFVILMLIVINIFRLFSTFLRWSNFIRQSLNIFTPSDRQLTFLFSPNIQSINVK